MAVEDVVPSARRGIKLIDTVKAVKDAEGKPRFSNMDEFQRFLQKSGMPMIGQTGGEASLELLNSIKIEVSLNDRDSLLNIAKTSMSSKIISFT